MAAPLRDAAGPPPAPPRGALPPAPMLLLPYFLLPQRRREIKMVQLGASGVGKSALAQRYVRAAARRRVIDVFSHSDTNRSGFWHPLLCAAMTRPWASRGVL